MRTLAVFILASTAIFAQAPKSPPAVLGGGPPIVAKFDATAQTASIATATLYAVPATQGGMYRFSCYVVLTQAAAGGTPTSTLPQCNVFWTDVDTSQAVSVSATTASVSNTLATNSSSQAPSGQTANPWINAKPGTVIQYATSGYTSTATPTAMQYAVHIKLEYLGQ